MKTVAIIIARMGSSRLPGKVLMDLGGNTVLHWVVSAARHAPGVDEVWVATTKQKADNAIWEWCEDNNVDCWRGSEHNVLYRFTETARMAEADIVVRLTGDCPFHDPQVIGEVIALRNATGVDYASNVDPGTWPDGLDCEVFTRETLEKTNKEAGRGTDRGCVTQYIMRNKAKFSTANLTCPIPGLYRERWVLDTENDYRFCQAIAQGAKGFSYLEILDFLNKNPELRKINAHHPRNERFFEDLVAEEPVKRQYGTSASMFRQTVSRVPLGTQTFSKSYLQYPINSPLFVTHGNGGLVYDVDGNDYVDLVMGLLPVVLGYRDPDVDWAVRQQLDKGVSLSLATHLESQLAEILCELIPCAQMARFGKNGTDVTQAAIRLSRAWTGRDKILSSGYHGWADAFIAHDPVRNLGVPKAVADLTTIFQYGDITEARRCLDTKEYACVIIEPETDAQFLSELRTLCTATGTILIFDEIITGFRFDLGGAQKIHGVVPDLATFGKSMANGYSISALVGQRNFMEMMPNICFSGTFFGETTSFVAALATIAKMRRESVLPKIHAMGRSLRVEVSGMDYASDFVSITGEYLQRLEFKGTNPEVTKTMFMQEMISNGVLVIGSHNLCFAHTKWDCERVLKAYQATFKKMHAAGNDIAAHVVGRMISAAANVRA